MNVSKMLDEYVAEQGKGNTRDALNVALARNDAMANQLLSLAKTLREANDPSGWTLFCAQQIERIVEVYRSTK